jgi:hypothetical protein
MERVTCEERRLLGVPGYVASLHGGHPGFAPQVTHQTKPWKIPFEIKLVPAGSALGAIDGDPVNFYLFYSTTLNWTEASPFWITKIPS